MYFALKKTNESFLSSLAVWDLQLSAAVAKLGSVAKSHDPQSYEVF